MNLTFFIPITAPTPPWLGARILQGYIGMIREIFSYAGERTDNLNPV